MTVRAFAITAALGLLAAAALPAHAALKVGDKAPDFVLPAATDGKVSTFSLRRALKRGPVVLYFYPKAFTTGCSLEAHEFSQTIGQFKARHVTVVGVSADDIDTLKKFSVQTCAGKFPVVADPDLVASIQYDAKIPFKAMANRISYVIDRHDHIAFVHQDPNAETHVQSLLEAVKDVK